MRCSPCRLIDSLRTAGFQYLLSLRVFPPVTPILPAVPDVFAPVADIFETIAPPAVVPRITPIFAAIANVFAPVAKVFSPVAHVFPPVSPVAWARQHGRGKPITTSPTSSRTRRFSWPTSSVLRFRRSFHLDRHAWRGV